MIGKEWFSGFDGLSWESKVCFRGFLARTQAKAEAVPHALPVPVVVG